jgi:hypothetical protein
MRQQESAGSAREPTMPGIPADAPRHCATGSCLAEALARPFAPLFTAPSFRTFCGLACGFLAQAGRRTVCARPARTRPAARAAGRE